MSSAAGDTADRAGTAPGGLGVVPTPAPAERFSPVRVWDESARPTAPPPDPGTVYPARGQAHAQHLIEVHDHLRSELGQLRDLVRRVATGDLDPGAARAALHATAMRQNRWALSTRTQYYCRFVTTHHTLEDVSLFPQLRRADPRLNPVIDRLAEEHEAMAGVLDRVDAALVAMADDAGRGVGRGVEQVRAAIDLLTDALLSHLSYEERELVEPMARLSTI